MTKCGSGGKTTYELIGDVDTMPFTKDSCRKSEDGYDYETSRLIYEAIEEVNTDPLYVLIRDKVRNNV